MERTMRHKLVIGVVSGSFLLAFAFIVVGALDLAPPRVQADSGRTVEREETSPRGTRLDGMSKATRWWDDKQTEVLSKLLDRPRRWSKLLEDWSDHILRRVMALGAPDIGMLYMMLALSFSLVHAFPQKTARKARPKRSNDL